MAPSSPLAHGGSSWRSWMALAAVGAAVAAARVHQLESLADRGVFAKYLVFAERILAGSVPVERLADLSPGYLWTVVLLCGPLGLGVEGILRVQLVLVGLAAVAVGVLGCRIGGRLAGWVACLALLTSKGAWLNATELEPETLALVLAAAVLTALLWRPADNRAAAAAGLLLGLSAVIRPTAAAAVPVLAGWLWWTVRRRERGTPRRAATAALLLVATSLLAPAAFRLASPQPTREGAPMNPGTVLYEGWNPMATGYLGEAPVVVKDLERGLAQPDALHVAYRRVAAAAGDTPANPFWGGLAAASLVELPGRSLALALDKAWLSLHSHEAWDLLTVWRRERLVAGAGWLPFGVLVALALVAVVHARARAETLALAAWSACVIAVMVAFYVTSRQRNPLLPAVALLAGLGLAALSRMWREGERRKLLTSAAAASLVAVVLLLPWHPQREDRHAWAATAEARAALRLAAAADDPRRAAELQGEAAVRLAPIPPDLPRAAVRAAAARRLGAALTPAARFDVAVGATRAGDWETADRVLAGLDGLGYRARRGAEVTGSVAYHRARCRLALGDPEGALRLVERAVREVPGDPWAAALAAELGARSGSAGPLARRQLGLLERLSDPFTASLARARALADLGERSRAAEIVEELRLRLPEWEGPLREASTW